MQIQQLRYFVAVAETRHFTHAADLVGVSQPSLSKQLRVLENDLGTPLLVRQRGGVVLTPAGEALLPIAQRIIVDVEDARRRVGEVVGSRRGRVRLGATPSLCGGLLAATLAEFHETFPEVDMQVTEGGSHDLVRELGRGRLDLALVVDPLRGDDPDLETLPLLRESLVVASSTALPPPTAGDLLMVDDLREMPLVMFRRGYILRETTMQACRAAGFEPQLAVEGGEMDAVLRFVEAGLGVAVVPTMVLQGRAGLRGTRLEGPRLSRTVSLAHRHGIEHGPAVLAFRRSLVHRLSALTDGELGAGIEVLEHDLA